MKRLLLIALCCLCVFTLTRQPAEALEAELGIGSEAPNLNVEHWIQTGEGYFDPVKKFKDGKVYVVEFWATWCGPCVESMPHLAELQRQYRGEGVQIISITDESVEEVEVFLERENEQVGKTFEEITSAYCLTADPDGSAHQEYMAAANQSGIPAAFIVGKSGLIEWIGHPMEMDEPLRQVVEGTWDREAYREELKRREEMQRIANETVQEINQLIGGGNVDEAIELLKTRIEETEYEQLADQLQNLLYEVRLTTGRRNAATVAHYREQLEQAKGNPVAVAQFGYMINSVFQQGGKPGPLTQDAIKAIKAELPEADDDLKPMMYVVLAQLHAATDEVDSAVKALQKGVDSAEGRQKERLQDALDNLKQQIEDAKNAGSEQAEDADSDE